MVLSEGVDTLFLRRLLVSLAIGVSGPSGFAAAQDIGSVAADRARLSEITGQAIRGDSDSATIRALAPFLPRVRITSNSALPYSLNDGSMWAGRGINLSVTTGMTAARDIHGAIVRAVLAPTLTYSENRAFQIRPLIASASSATAPGRSPFSSPWHTGTASADLPLRFGDQTLRTIDFGESSISVERSGLAVGATSGDNWWGPGRRNALLMSNNGPGIPRAFVRTARPVRTRVGSFDAELIAGVLGESAFFDSVPANDRRSLSGLRISWQPASMSGLTLGVGRVLYRPMPGSRAGLAGRAFDVLRIWERLAAPGDTTASGGPRQRTDQIASVFARWFDPGSGLEVYGEWARMELPRSMADLLESTSHTLGYTMGLQYAVRERTRNLLNFQAEVTNLEQSVVIPDRPPPSYYTGRVSPHGFTNRGQIVGATIGPGSSSQWFAIDYLAEHWQAGVFMGRVRTENDVAYNQPGFGRLSHDVTLLGGVRTGVRARGYDVSSELTIGKRNSYLFQHDFGDPLFPTVDLANVTLSFLFTPRSVENR